MVQRRPASQPLGALERGEVFARMVAGLAAEAEAEAPETAMIGATYLKAHRPASSLRSKGAQGRSRGGSSAARRAG